MGSRFKTNKRKFFFTQHTHGHSYVLAFFTLVERKDLGYIQLRKDPNIVGPYGLRLPVAGGVKLFIKEPIYPLRLSLALFTLAPILALLLALSI
uniref:NADH-ubiquinone oxidoreductase chain 1 n=1 Tax=Terrapene triunguis TaxID=2587831 RepID=A0A674JQW9_9SAUR